MKTIPIQRWRRKAQTGSHSFSWQGRKYRVKPGDTVEVPEHILGSFVEKYVLVSDLKSTKPGTKKPAESKKETPGKRLEIIEITKGYYNVINPDNPDKPLNEDPMTLDQAKELIDSSSIGETPK